METREWTMPDAADSEMKAMTKEEIEDCNSRDTPEKEILWASGKGEIEIVKNILQLNSSLVNVKDSDGYSPLHRACYSNNVDVTKVLLEHGADVKACTAVNWTPLHSACKWNHYECALLLLDYGADINAMTDGGHTPLHLASHHPECRELLILLLTHPEINVKIRNNSSEFPYDIAHRHCKNYYLYDLQESCINEI